MAVTKEIVFETCEALRGAQTPVTFRTVYAHTGGSRTRVCTWWRAWTALAQAEPALLPEAFREAMQRFLEVDEWEARYQALRRTLVPEAETQLQALQAHYAESTALLQQVREQVTLASAELTVLRSDVAANRRTLAAFLTGEGDQGGAEL
jgi:hypothetical protein